MVRFHLTAKPLLVCCDRRRVTGAAGGAYWQVKDLRWVPQLGRVFRQAWQATVAAGGHSLGCSFLRTLSVIAIGVRLWGGRIP